MSFPWQQIMIGRHRHLTSPQKLPFTCADIPLIKLKKSSNVFMNQDKKKGKKD